MHNPCSFFQFFSYFRREKIKKENLETRQVPVPANAASCLGHGAQLILCVLLHLHPLQLREGMLTPMGPWVPIPAPPKQDGDSLGEDLGVQGVGEVRAD